MLVLVLLALALWALVVRSTHDPPCEQLLARLEVGAGSSLFCCRFVACSLSPAAAVPLSTPRAKRARGSGGVLLRFLIVLVVIR